MNFTPEHIITLEGNKSLWESLFYAGFIINLDKPLFDSLHTVFNEAIDRRSFYTYHCGECRADMVRVLYTQYDKFKAAYPEKVEDALKTVTDEPDTSNGGNRPKGKNRK